MTKKYLVTDAMKLAFQFRNERQPYAYSEDELYPEYSTIAKDIVRYWAMLDAYIKGHTPLIYSTCPEADPEEMRMPENSTSVIGRLRDPLPPTIVEHITTRANLFSQFQGLHIYSRNLDGETFLFFQHMTCLTDEDVRAMTAFCIVDRFFFRTKLRRDADATRDRSMFPCAFNQVMRRYPPVYPPVFRARMMMM